jgi:hypothetical protein
MGKEECSFLKKRTKKLLIPGVRGRASIHAKDQKFFASFFQKRRPFLLLGARPCQPIKRPTATWPWTLCA